MKTRPPGKFEFDLLQFLAEHGGLAVREIHQRFGTEHGYTRGTVVKAMDRLLKKGMVRRENIDGIFRYQAVIQKEELDRQLVETFVRERLGGRIKPIAMFLTETEGLDAREAELLQALLNKIRP